MYMYLSQCGSVFDDIFIGGEEDIESRLSNLLSQTTTHSRCSLDTRSSIYIIHVGACMAAKKCPDFRDVSFIEIS